MRCQKSLPAKGAIEKNGSTSPVFVGACVPAKSTSLASNVFSILGDVLMKENCLKRRHHCFHNPFYETSIFLKKKTLGSNSS